MINLYVIQGCCAFPPIGSMILVYTENNSSSCAVEGANVTYSCQPELVPNERRMAYCMRDGSWNPDPNELECHPTATEINSPTSGIINYYGICAKYLYIASA